jgi:predicted MFS family arabinose efflux permease
MDLRSFTQTASKIGLLVFLVGIATGRLIVGYLSQDKRISRLIITLFGFASLTFAVLYLIGLGQWTYFSVFFAGFSISAILPLIITLAGQLYPEMAGTVIGSIKIAIPIGGILLPFLMSLVARYASLQAALLIFPLALLLAFSILLLEIKNMPSLETRSA